MLFNYVRCTGHPGTPREVVYPFSVRRGALYRLLIPHMLPASVHHTFFSARHGSPILRPFASHQVAFMQPAATFIDYVHTIQILQYSRRLYIPPVVVFFPSAARELAHNNRFGPLPRKG